MLYEVDWAEDGTYRPGEYYSPEKFFDDCLHNSNEFDLQLGYFSSAAISVLADGFASFISTGGRMRLVINHIVFRYLQTTDYPVGKLTEEEFPLLDNDDILVKEDIFRLLRESGVGVPAYYEEIPFEVDGKTGTYCRSRSGCYFCFFQQRIEWVWLYEQHPDLFAKAMEFEKDGYTWIQGEPLSDLIKPERIRQIKLDIIKKQEAAKATNQGTTLVDILGDDIMCANCFI